MVDEFDMDIESMKVSELQEQLKMRGLDYTGVKRKLVARLREAIENVEEANTQGEQNKNAEDIQGENMKYSDTQGENRKSSDLQREQDEKCDDVQGEQDEKDDDVQGEYDKIFEIGQREVTPVKVNEVTEKQIGTTQTQLSFNMTQFMNILQNIQAQNNEMTTQNNEIKTQNKEIKNKLEVLDIQTNEIKQTIANINNTMGLQQIKIVEVESRLEQTDIAVSNLEENFAREIEIRENKLVQLKNDLDTKFKSSEEYVIKTSMKINKRIDDVEKHIKEGIQSTLDISEMELKRTERKLEQEIRKMGSEGNGRNDNMPNNSNKELEERIEWLKKEIRDLKKNRECTEVREHLVCVGRQDENAKFCGDYRKIHPMDFIRSIRNKARNINGVENLREFIREHLTGQALLWFCCKESTVSNLDSFEDMFIDNFWGEIQQGKVRERLYFGKFDNQRGNLTNYALQIYALTQHLIPSIPEPEIVMFISRHFKIEIAETIAVQNISEFDKLIKYLSRIERNLNNSKSNTGVSKRTEQEQTQNQGRNQNRNYVELINSQNRNKGNVGHTNFNDRPNNNSNGKNFRNINNNYNSGGNYRSSDNFRNNGNTNWRENNTNFNNCTRNNYSNNTNRNNYLRNNYPENGNNNYTNNYQNQDRYNQTNHGNRQNRDTQTRARRNSEGENHRMNHINAATAHNRSRSFDRSHSETRENNVEASSSSRDRSPHQGDQHFH